MTRHIGVNFGWTLASLFAVVAGLCLTGCPASRSARGAPVPLLAERYMPSASAPSHAPMHEAVEPVADDPTMRRQRLMAPDGNVYTLKWRKYSSSLGAANGGTLHDPARLPARGPGFRHRGDNAYGTDACVTYVQWAAWTVAKQFPGTVPVVVGDLSDSDGGRLSPHKSHQSGRDADIGYFAKNNKPLRWFKTLGDELDVRKTWVFVEALIRTNAIKYIFIDKTIQIVLYEEARRLGFSDADLKSVFQYPGGNRGSLIRHVRGHKNHLHVRFKCYREDVDCK